MAADPLLQGMSFILPTDLPDLLDERGLIRLLPVADVDLIDRDSLRFWCHQKARYGIVTAELVDWLREFIGSRSAIEIGSGHGDLAHHLGIRATDNRMQERASVRALYAAMGQPLIEYPDWVEKADAVAAVRKHKPQVVVASWVTHWIDPRLPVPEGGGNMFGVRESEIVAEGVVYVMIGNRFTHGHKPILKLPHEEFRFPWLRSRSAQPELDRIFVWNETQFPDGWQAIP